MPTHKLVNAKFIEIPDPLKSEEGDNVLVKLTGAGFVEVAGTRVDGAGAEISLYSRTGEAPLYFIEIVGMRAGIAEIVADNFTHPIETLKELHPLLTLVGLDQVNMLRIDHELEKDAEERRRLGLPR